MRFRFYRYFRAVIRFAAVPSSRPPFLGRQPLRPSPGQNLAAFLVAVFSQIFIFPASTAGT